MFFDYEEIIVAGYDLFGAQRFLNYIREIPHQDYKIEGINEEGKRFPIKWINKRSLTLVVGKKKEENWIMTENIIKVISRIHNITSYEIRCEVLLTHFF